MTIHEIAQKTGLTKKAISYYEKKGLISPEYNPENGYRVFSDQDLKSLAVIALLRQMEIPVEKIGLVLDGKISTNELLKERLLTIDTDIESLKSEQEEEMPAPPPANIAELPPDQVELVRGLLRISAFVREELGERLAPLRRYLTVLSSSYGKTRENLSLMNDVMHQCQRSLLSRWNLLMKSLHDIMNKIICFNLNASSRDF